MITSFILLLAVLLMEGPPTTTAAAGSGGGGLYAWGPTAGDSQLLPAPTPGDPLASLQLNFTLATAFTIFGGTHTSLHLNKQGIIVFNGGSPLPYLSPQSIVQDPLAGGPPTVFPLLGEVDPYKGVMHYRQTTNRSLLLEVTRDVKTAFPSLKDLGMDWALVVTWEGLTFWEPPYYQNPNCSCLPKLNTFQAVLTTSGSRSFVLFNYDRITWPKNPWSDWEGINYLKSSRCSPTAVPLAGDMNSVAGISFLNTSSSEPSSSVFTLPVSIFNLTERSNIFPEVKGRWVFRVDDQLRSSACNFADSDIEQIRVDPAVVCQLGHLPLRIRGPCLRNASNVECRFYDPSFSGQSATPFATTVGVVEPDLSHVVCQAPLFPTAYSRVVVELAFTRTQRGADGLEVREDRNYKGQVFAYPPDAVPTERRLNLHFHADGEVHLSWNPSIFAAPPSSPSASTPSPSVILLQLVLVVLDLSSVTTPRQRQHQQIAETMVTSSVFNSGSFTWPLGVNSGLFRSPKVGYFAYLTPVEDQSPSVYLHSDIVYTSISSTKETYATLCEDWHLKDTGLGDTDNLAPCPPLLDQATFDWNFLQEPSAGGGGGHQTTGDRGQLVSFRQRVPTPGGSCQRCVYSEMDGRLVLDPPAAATAYLECSDRYMAHQLRDLLPRHWCLAASSPEAWAKYVERRTSRSSLGLGYVSPRLSFWRGDPHLTTWDNLTYTFNPVGEFWLVSSVDFGVQARMSQFQKQNASVFTAFAIRQRTPLASVQVSLGGTGLRLWVNGEEVDPPPSSGASLPIIINTIGVSVALHKMGMELERVTLSFSSGFTFDIAGVEGADALNVAASVPASLKNKSLLTGLLGDFDGNPGNDFRLLTGGVVLNTASPSLAQVHQWGLQWRTTPGESLFLYHGGKTHPDFQNVNFLPNLREPNVSAIPKKVLETCGGLRECLFDFGTTGSVALAKATKDIAVAVEEMDQIFKKKPPVPCNHPHCVDVTTYTPRTTTGRMTTSDSHNNGPSTTTKKSTSGAARATLTLFSIQVGTMFISIVFFLLSL